MIDLAAAGAVDPQYVSMLNDIENCLAAMDIHDDSELMSIQGLLGELGLITLPDGNHLVVRNGVEKNLENTSP